MIPVLLSGHVPCSTGVDALLHTVPTSTESGRVCQTESKSYWDSTDAYCTVPLVTVRYRYRQQAMYRAVQVSPRRRTLYRSVRNLTVCSEPKPNQTVIARTYTAKNHLSQYNTSVATWPYTAQYRGSRLAAQCTDLYGIWPPLCSTARHIAIPLFPYSRVLCIRKKDLRPDIPGARDALDAPWQGTYGSQRETHRQCEFGRSSPWHRAFGHRMPGHRASGRSSPWHLLTRRSVSGYFPSGHSHVRAFSFWTQLCQGKWHPDDACHGTTVTLSVKARNTVANTLVVFANTQRVPGIVTQSSSIHSI